MAKAEFSLQRRDRRRYIKDRLARFTVISGGIGVLAAILLIFFYLLVMVLPIFSDAEVAPLAQYRYQSKAPIVGLGIDDYGENTFLFDSSGNLNYVGFEDEHARALLSTQIIDQATAFTQESSADGWYAYGNQVGQIVAVRPSFNVSFTGSGRVLTPNMDAFNDGKPIQIDPNSQPIKLLTIAINEASSLFVAVNEQNQASGLIAEKITLPHVGEPDSHEYLFRPLSLPSIPKSVTQMALSPDGKQLFILAESDLIVAQRLADRFVVREVVDISRNNSSKAVRQMTLLSGAQSLLFVHQDNTVSQWFDVLKNGARLLTKIREFPAQQPVELLVADLYKKGFYTFNQAGVVAGYYTTSENLVFTEKLYDRVPHIAAVSANERYLIASENNRLVTHQLDNPHPEVSFSALWQIVWYENYPEPQYVWQSTSASNDFEAKFSLVPIAFGTLKATFFAMLFSVPLALGGAIYTAYFMSSPMRKTVKPAIEIMEALPTVIIGFLAGLWLAPIVETHLSAVVAIILFLPLAAICVGAIWHMIPRRVLGRIPSGWHAITLIPVFLLLSYGLLEWSGDIERWLFGGDIRVFLADYGINYDQRNALVVGLAMGFAVIPTIFTIAEDAIFSVPKHLSDGSLALGATPWQTLLHVVLLTASPGIFSAVMIGLGRAVGETMIVLMATGNTPIMDFSLFEGMRSLSATIAVEMPESEVGDTHYRLLFLAALLLFIFTFAVNSVAEIVRQRLRERYRSM